MLHSAKIDRKVLNEFGFSIPELVVVMLVIAILSALALPSVLSSRRLATLGSLPFEVTTTLREARQAAMSQRKQISVEYDDSAKKFIVYGGKYGAKGSWKNKIVWITGGGLGASDIKYGPAPGTGSPTLGDGTTNSTLNANIYKFNFEGDGSVRDSSDNPVDFALFFYDQHNGKSGSFAVSVLGVTGRVKIWRYSGQQNAYAE